jgi:prolipoprotein diacylglyceryltransferase
VLPFAASHAVIELSFDPVLRIGDWAVRLETIGLALVAFLALVVAARVARTTPVDPTRPADAPGDDPAELNRLRADDLLYIAVAALPGAVVGARLGYALLHLEFYQANAAALLDINQGGFELTLGVVGGLISSSIVAGLLGAPLGHWLHAMTLPVLLALAGGKAAMVLGGSGQGQLSDASWATAFTGPGPWGSLGPALPAHPAQLYEAAATIGVIVIVMWVLAFDAFPGRNGGAFLFGIGAWAVARTIVATTWRDPEVVGPLRAEQLISIAVAAGSFLVMLLVGATSVLRGRRRAREAPATVGTTGTAPGVAAAAAGAAIPVAPATPRAGGEPEWPDPTTRPRI